MARHRTPTLTRRAGRAPLAAALAALATGCGGEADAPDWTVRVDTLPSGAVHVLNVPPEEGVRPTWVLEEELRIGAVDGAGPGTFAEVKGLAVLADGRIAVLDAQARELRIFGPDGAHLATHGRKGAGPGELEEGFGLMLGPDGDLWVPDHRNLRMSVYDPDDGFQRSYRWEQMSYGYVWRGVMTDDGRILRPSILLDDSGRRNVIRVYDREMNLVDTLPLPPSPDWDPKDPPGAFYWEAAGGLPRGYIPVPFYPGGHALLDPRGEIWSAEGGDPSYRIKRWTPGGDTTLVVETRRDLVPVTATERDSAIDAIRRRLEERGAADADWSKIPETKPPVLSMFVAEDGRLWVRTPSGGERRMYDIYERNGRRAGTAVTSLDIVDPVRPIVRRDRVWAVVTDELDVPYVVRARLVPATPTGGT